MQLAVDRVHLCLGRLQQFLHRGGDLGLQVVLEHLTLVRGEQRPALGDLALKPRAEPVGALGAVLVDDADDQPVLARLGLRLVGECGEGAAEICEVVSDLGLDAVPGVVVIGHVGEQLFGAPRQAERRVDGPRRARVRQFRLGQRHRHQPGGAEALQVGDGLLAGAVALGQRGFIAERSLLRHGAGFAGNLQRLGGCLVGLFAGPHGAARGIELAFELVHLLADAALQRLQAHG